LLYSKKVAAEGSLIQCSGISNIISACHARMLLSGIQVFITNGFPLKTCGNDRKRHSCFALPCKAKPSLLQTQFP